MLSVRPVRAMLTLALAAVAAFGALPAASGQAAAGGSADCQLSALSQPFAAFGDLTTYELVPGGDFAGTLGGWSVQGGAGLTGGGGSYSLSLPPGAVATSPPACINVVFPTVRFYASADGPRARLKVAAVLQNPSRTVAIPMGTVTPGPELAPVQPLTVQRPIRAAVDGNALVSLRFEASRGTVQIDDVYIDPWRSG